MNVVFILFKPLVQATAERQLSYLIETDFMLQFVYIISNNFEKVLIFFQIINALLYTIKIRQIKK